LTLKQHLFETPKTQGRNMARLMQDSSSNEKEENVNRQISV